MSVIPAPSVKSPVSYRRDELRSPCRGDAGWSQLSKHLSPALLPQQPESRGRGGGQWAGEDSSLAGCSPPRAPAWCARCSEGCRYQSLRPPQTRPLVLKSNIHNGAEVPDHRSDQVHALPLLASRGLDYSLPWQHSAFGIC